jgi:hypothetical protein
VKDPVPPKPEVPTEEAASTTPKVASTKSLNNPYKKKVLFPSLTPIRMLRR